MKGFIMGFLLASILYGAASQAQSASTSVGRFSLHQSTMLARQTFLLDTVTGQVRNLVTEKDGAYFWEQNGVQGINAK